MFESKIILIDWMIFVHRSIFAWRKNKQIPPEYTCINMIVSCLRRIGIEPYDRIIIATDGRNSWRKDYEKSYKENRKAFRESFEDIDWNDMFKRFDILLWKLKMGTDWNILKADRIEFDDWAAVACRYYNGNEVILITYDSDMFQLLSLDNVKVFSPLLKPKRYKVKPKNFNPYEFLSKKIRKEASDNLVNEISNTEEYDNRMLCVNLLELPDFVENRLIEEFKNLKYESGNSEYIPFDGIREKIVNLCNDTKDIITYEQSVAIEAKKKTKKEREK